MGSYVTSTFGYPMTDPKLENPHPSWRQIKIQAMICPFRCTTYRSRILRRSKWFLTIYLCRPKHHLSRARLARVIDRRNQLIHTVNWSSRKLRGSTSVSMRKMNCQERERVEKAFPYSEEMRKIVKAREGLMNRVEVLLEWNLRIVKSEGKVSFVHCDSELETTTAFVESMNISELARYMSLISSTDWTKEKKHDRVRLQSIWTCYEYYQYQAFRQYAVLEIWSFVVTQLLNM